jgi:dTDP-glucose 4,6-dehydratase
MKLVVTGGAGFIGSNFIRYWLKAHPKDQLINLDKLSYAGNPANVGEFQGDARYQFVQGDILDQKTTDQLLENADYLIHFAAESHVTRSEDTPEVFYQNNVAGTKALLEVAAKHRLKKVVHISTDEVYGSIEGGYFKEADKRPGDGQASSAYAKSKSQADDIAQSYFDKLPLVIVRPTNNFGPNQYPEKALPRWVTNALLDRPLKIWGKGEQVRDWLYTEDTARAIELLLTKASTPDIYNIGANHEPEFRNIDIALLVLKQLGKPESLLQFIPDPRPDHDFRYGVDTGKIRALGWEKGDFAKQLHDTVAWYRANQAWWQAIKQEAESLYQNREQK